MLEIRKISDVESAVKVEGDEFTIKELKLDRMKKLLHLQTEIGELSKKYLTFDVNAKDIEAELTKAYKVFIENVPLQIITKFLNIVLIPTNKSLEISEDYVAKIFSVPDLYDIVLMVIKQNKIDVVYQHKSFLSGNPNLPIAQ